MKFVGYFIVLVIALFVFVANFSSVESRFSCSGEISHNGNTETSTIYIKLEEYRWWVGLWSDSDGNFFLEIPNTHVEYYSNVLDTGTQIQILGHQKELKGNFSKLSKTLALDTPFGFFDGTCRVTD